MLFLAFRTVFPRLPCITKHREALLADGCDLYNIITEVEYLSKWQWTQLGWLRYIKLAEVCYLSCGLARTRDNIVLRFGLGVNCKSKAICFRIIITVYVDGTVFTSGSGRTGLYSRRNKLFRHPVPLLKTIKTWNYRLAVKKWMYRHCPRRSFESFVPFCREKQYLQSRRVVKNNIYRRASPTNLCSNTLPNRQGFSRLFKTP